MIRKWVIFSMLFVVIAVQSKEKMKQDANTATYLLNNYEAVFVNGGFLDTHNHSPHSPYSGFFGEFEQSVFFKNLKVVKTYTDRWIYTYSKNFPEVGLLHVLAGGTPHELIPLYEKSEDRFFRRYCRLVFCLDGIKINQERMIPKRLIPIKIDADLSVKKTAIGYELILSLTNRTGKIQSIFSSDQPFPTTSMEVTRVDGVPVFYLNERLFVFEKNGVVEDKSRINFLYERKRKGAQSEGLEEMVIFPNGSLTRRGKIILKRNPIQCSTYIWTVYLKKQSPVYQLIGTDAIISGEIDRTLEVELRYVYDSGMFNQKIGTQPYRIVSNPVLLRFNSEGKLIFVKKEVSLTSARIIKKIEVIDPAPESLITNLMDKISFNKKGMHLVIKKPHLIIKYSGENNERVIIAAKKGLETIEYLIPFSHEVGAEIRTDQGEQVLSFETLPPPYENKGFLVCYGEPRRINKFGRMVQRVICSDPLKKKIVLIEKEDLKTFFLKQGFDAEKVLSEREAQRKQKKNLINKIRKKAIYAIDRQIPVIFPEGEYGNTLKTFIIEDLNRIFGAEEILYTGDIVRGPITWRLITQRIYSRLYSKSYLSEFLGISNAKEINENLIKLTGMKHLGLNAKKMTQIVQIETDISGITKLILTPEGMRIYKNKIQENEEIYPKLLRFFEKEFQVLNSNSIRDMWEKERYHVKKPLNRYRTSGTFIQPSIFSIYKENSQIFAILPCLKRSKNRFEFTPVHIIYKNGSWELFQGKEKK